MQGGDPFVQELNESELLSKIKEEANAFALFVHTPFCGTCALAHKMLQIVEAMGRSIPIYTINIAFAPRFREHYRIGSVPCLGIFEQGAMRRKEYALHSVDQLYVWLIPE